MNFELLDQSIKVATLNVMHPPVEVDARFELLVTQTQELKPDILLLQEVSFHPTEPHSEMLMDLAQATGMHIAAAQANKGHGLGSHRDGTAILTTFDVLDSGVTTHPESHSGPSSVWAHMKAPGGRSVIAFTMHGAWGGPYVHRRLDLLADLEINAAHLETLNVATEPIIILGGDLNAVPEEDSIRFLKGLTTWRNAGTYWVDAWDQAGSGPGHTSTPQLRAARDVARIVGIQHASANPDRRIDYIFLRGWVYGRPGMPLDAQLCFEAVNGSGYTASDHLGVVSRIWCPPLAAPQPVLVEPAQYAEPDTQA